MNASDPALRILVLAPTGKDAALSQSLLERAGMPCKTCRDLDEIRRELDVGAGALMLPEEAIALDRKSSVVRWLEHQPPWSDLPVIVLARAGADSAAVAQAMDQLGNITVVERPMRVAALVSVLRSAVRARARQYELREHLAQREGYLQALREADRRKDEFLATLAHELRNPLAPIRNSLQVLRMRGRGDPSTDNLTAMMERQVNQMVRLVDDLLEMSRVTRGRIELRLEHVDVAAVLRNAVETSRPLIDAARHQLTVTLPAEPLTLHGDPVRLAQIFANLLNNAAKYTEEGGRITVTAERDGMAVTIAVRDTGTGIPQEMLPRVFDLFTQLPAAARRAHGGLGIGLTLVKSLVEMHGGTVQVYSAGPGKGSEFTVRLPLVVADARAAVEPGERPLLKLPARRVLVVDDNADAAESMSLLLGMLGLTTHVANSGQAALEALAAFKPSVVFLDIGMPVIDGHEVARRIRAQPEWQGLTLVAMTGWGQDEDRRRSQSAGFDHHLIKPVDVRALEALLRGLDERDRQAAAPSPQGAAR
jgi:signal transduction histidine kinase/ActR/RegA family two-component response regulator